MTTPSPVFAPLMMSVADFARLHGISETVVRECIAGASTSYPPLRAKRTKGKRKYLHITAEAAAEWRAALDDN